MIEVFRHRLSWKRNVVVRNRCNKGFQTSRSPQRAWGARSVPTLRLKGTDGALFNVQASSQTETARLTFKDAPDHEAPADDGGGQTSTTLFLRRMTGRFSTDVSIEVRVTDVVELPTINEPTGTSAVRVEFSHPENSGTVITRFTADSKGGGDLSWSVNNDGSDYPLVRSASGEIFIQPDDARL